ncbi:MAG: T9SS type A sorting domain-containing protein [Bacteroidia bacterium]|nr:T9SS type A sorting domain-containing protein [Bacteroidia bacterium]
MQKTTLFLILTFLVIFTFSESVAYAQSSVCGTDDPYEYYRGTNTTWNPETDPNEIFYRAFIDRNSELLNPSFKVNAANARVIPVVVHVIHDEVADVPFDEKIGVEQILSQFDILNQDYRRMPGSRGFGSGADMGIEFQLATKDPQGNPHSGINYLSSPLTAHSKNNDANLKNLIKWDQTKYLNVWLVKSMEPAGYATFPTTIFNPNDGVVILSTHWGVTGSGTAPGRSGRTAPHEFGHWLSLFHNFQGGCGTSNCNTSGDNVCDTPPTIEKSEIKGSNPRQNSCITDNPDLPDNSRNYMDYSGDDYVDMFTAGQRTRAIATLNNPGMPQRYQMTTDANHEATGIGKYAKPKALFWVSNQNPCINTEIKFTDYSQGYPDHWEWSFPGGTPTTSNVQEPTVYYTQPGTYEVSLRVANITDTSTLFVRTGFITVSDTSYTLPFTEDFEAAVFPPRHWKLDNPDFAWPGSVKWDRWTYESGFNQSTACVRMACANYPSMGQRDGLITPSLNFTGVAHPKLSFSLAYNTMYFERLAASGSDPISYFYDYNDTLAVYASEDCGQTYQRVFYKGGTDLKTTSRNSYNGLIFSQLAQDEWKKFEIDLTPFANKTNVQFRIETINGYGNHVYLDDLHIFADTASVSRESAMNQLTAQVFPNPNNGLMYITTETQSQEEITVSVWDVHGKNLKTIQYKPVSKQTVSLNLHEENLIPGIYLLKIQQRERVFSQKILIQ